MKYMMLIYHDEAEFKNRSESVAKELYQEFVKFAQDAGAAGALVDGAPLASTEHATTVRIREGKTLTIDGPFAETKEQLGGFFILDCENLDEALGYAAKIPASRFGSIEVRPLMKLSLGPQQPTS